MPIVEALSFKMLVDEPYKNGHQQYRCEGRINTGLEEHLKECAECRNTIAKDLRDFAAQIEAIGAQTLAKEG